MRDRLPWPVAVVVITALSPLAGVALVLGLAALDTALRYAVWSVAVLAEVVR